MVPASITYRSNDKALHCVQRKGSNGAKRTGEDRWELLLSGERTSPGCGVTVDSERLKCPL